MKRVLLVSAALLLMVVSAACSNGANEDRNGSTYTYSQMTTSPGYGDYYNAPVPSIIVTKGAESSESSGVTIYTSDLPEDRMIVRTGNMSIVVNDIDATLSAISQLADSSDGYVVSSNTWKNGESVYGSISIRVAAGSYDTALAAISQMAVEVTSQSTSSEDVTAEYVDLSAQLSSLEATEEQLLLIMSRATTVEDTLAVQAQLTKIQTQIEQIKGRMQYLEKTSATSLITVSLSQSKLGVTFTASSVNAKTGNELHFNPNVAGGFTPYSYEWNFGDGKTSTESNPSHAYAKAGEYTVSLKITDDRGNTVTETRETYIRITQGGWSIGGIAGGAWNALLWLGRGLVSLVIILAVFSPVALVVWLIIWLARRKKAKAS
jgi:PKD repeat protein